MAFIDFLIDTSSNNDGAHGASSYFKKLDNSELELMMQVVISSLRIFSVGHYRNCNNVLALYGGQRLATLDEYRYYNRNIAIKSMGARLTLAALPPTSAAAREQSKLLCLIATHAERRLIA